MGLWRDVLHRLARSRPDARLLACADRAGGGEVLAAWDLRREFGEVRLGALRDNTITLRAVGVGRRHAALTWDEGGLTISDRGSPGGTFVDGAKANAQRLAHGALVRLGDVVLRVVLDPAELARGAPESPRMRLLRERSEQVGVGVLATLTRADDARVAWPLVRRADTFEPDLADLAWFSVGGPGVSDVPLFEDNGPTGRRASLGLSRSAARLVVEDAKDRLSVDGRAATNTRLNHGARLALNGVVWVFTFAVRAGTAT